MRTRRRFWQGTGLFQRVSTGKNSAEALRIENYSFRRCPILARSVRKGGTPRRIPLGSPAKSESAPNGLARRGINQTSITACYWMVSLLLSDSARGPKVAVYSKTLSADFYKLEITTGEHFEKVVSSIAAKGIKKETIVEVKDDFFT